MDFSVLKPQPKPKAINLTPNNYNTMMFKKLLYSTFAVIAFGVVCACTSTTETDEPAANEMTFTATQASRSSLVTDESLTDFVVYANMVSSNKPSSLTPVFEGTTVSKTADGWAYDNTQYWFPGQTYSFAAVHFSNTENISNLTYSDDKLSFRYTAPTDYSQADDILAAAHRRKYTSGPTTPVALNLGHIMARVNFVANVDAAVPDAVVTIHNIELSGVASRATYTLQPAALLSGSTQTNDLAGAGWTVSSTPMRITLSKNVGITLHAGESASLFDATEDPLLLIPQAITSDVEVSVTYSNQTGKTTTVVGRLRTSAASHGYVWSAGRAYSYSFSLGIDDFLLFSPTDLNAWDEDEGGTYIVVG